MQSVYLWRSKFGGLRVIGSEASEAVGGGESALEADGGGFELRLQVRTQQRKKL